MPYFSFRVTWRGRARGPPPRRHRPAAGPACDAGHHLVGARRREAESLAEDVSPANRQVVIVLHDGGPTTFQQPANMLDGGGKRAVAERSRVPVQSNSWRKRVVSPSGKVMPWLMVSGWMSACLSLRTWRKAEPCGRTATCGSCWWCRRHRARPVERHHADAVRSVEQHSDTLAFQLRRQFLKGHAKTGGAGDGVDHRQHGAVGDAPNIASKTTCGPSMGNGRGTVTTLAPPLSHEVNRVAAGLIGVVGDEDFIALVEHQRAHDGVHARGGVVHQRQIIRVAREHLGQGVASGRHLFEAFAVKERHRFVLHAVLPAALLFANRRRRGSKGAVVEKHRLGVDPQWTAKSLREGRSMLCEGRRRNINSPSRWPCPTWIE